MEIKTEGLQKYIDKLLDEDTPVVGLDQRANLLSKYVKKYKDFDITGKIAAQVELMVIYKKLEDGQN